MVDLGVLSPELGWLLLALLAAAALYSTSGHGGATAYLALFGLFGLAPGVMRPVALLLNVVVAGLGSVRLARAGAMPWRTLLALLAGSIPGTFIGGLVVLPATTYRGLLGAALLVAAARLILPQSADGATLRRAPPAALVALGVVLGVLSGLTGIGGGIFLSPVLILGRFEDPRRTAGAAAAFIVINSITGLGALAVRGGLSDLPWTVALLGVVVLVGGIIGSAMAAKRLSLRGLRAALGVVLVLSGTKLLSEALWPKAAPTKPPPATTTTATDAVSPPLSP